MVKWSRVPFKTKLPQRPHLHPPNWGTSRTARPLCRPDHWSGRGQTRAAPRHSLSLVGLAASWQPWSTVWRSRCSTLMPAVQRFCWMCQLNLFRSCPRSHTEPSTCTVLTNLSRYAASPPLQNCLGCNKNRTTRVMNQIKFRVITMQVHAECKSVLLAGCRTYAAESPFQHLAWRGIGWCHTVNPAANARYGLRHASNSKGGRRLQPLAQGPQHSKITN